VRCVWHSAWRWEHYHGRLLRGFVIIFLPIFDDIKEEEEEEEDDDDDDDDDDDFCQQNCVSHHFSHELRSTLKSYFLIGEFEEAEQHRGLSPLEFFFLWGFTKYVLYASKVRKLRHLRERINTSVVAATTEMLRRTWNDTEDRPYVCRV
jgi:hypothetical protein